MTFIRQWSFSWGSICLSVVPDLCGPLLIAAIMIDDVVIWWRPRHV